MKRKLLLLILAMMLPWSAGAASAPFWVEFVDVGAGDCILIGCDDAVMMVDTGPVKAWDAVSAAMDARNVTQLDVLVVTHPHPDHTGNVARVLKKCPTAEMWVSASADETTREGAPKTVSELGVPVYAKQRGDRAMLGRAVVQVIWPDGRPQALVNDQSIVLRIEYNGFSVLLTGDAERDAEMQMVAGAAELPITADLLKAGHHGLNTSTVYPFASAVRATYAVISCAGAGKKIVTAPQTLDTLIRCGAKSVLETGTVGNILLEIAANGQLTIAGEGR